MTPFLSGGYVRIYVTHARTYTHMKTHLEYLKLTIQANGPLLEPPCVKGDSSKAAALGLGFGVSGQSLGFKV